ncbi:MAG TPA: hypothetical protein VLF79_03180 [Candidatus Saccharimonadales bacterium]|nr:hypothetical protein [Candidatus Saccharimonadales bacterium]
MSKHKFVPICAWSVTSLAVFLAIIVWGQSLNWHLSGISNYLLFPIFGLIAFSILWSQYMSLAARQYFKIDSSVLKIYFNVTGWLVLFSILLHPGLLVWQQWRNGDGLPPGSELHYVTPGLEFVVILGMINLTILLLFEFRRWLSKYSWWHYFLYIVDIAIISIFYHGLKLGSQLQTGWYRYIWIFYGLSYLAAIIYIYRQRYVNHQKVTSG